MADHMKADDYAPFTEKELSGEISWSPSEGFTALQTLLGRSFATMKLIANQRDVFAAAYQKALNDMREARRVARVLAMQLDRHGSYFGVDQDDADAVERDVNAALAYPEVPE